jgi:hypothetical protein
VLHRWCRAPVAALCLVLWPAAGCGDGDDDRLPSASPETAFADTDPGRHAAPLVRPGGRAGDRELIFEMPFSICTLVDGRQAPYTVVDTEVVEEPDAITVTVLVEADPSRPESECEAPGLAAVAVPTVRVELDAPVAARAVLDGSCDPPAPVPRFGDPALRCLPAPTTTVPAGAVGTWEQVDPGPLAGRAEAIAVAVGDDVVVVGGTLPRGLATDAAAFHLPTRTWRPLPGTPDGRLARLGAAAGDEVLVLTAGPRGYPADGAFALDPATGTWRATAPVPFPVDSEPDVRSTGDGAVVWVAGRALSPTDPAGAVYDPAADRWTPVPPIGRDVDDVVAAGRATWADGALVVVAARSTGPVLLRYDPASGVWSVSSPPPGPFRDALVVPVWNGREVVLPGSRGGATAGPAPTVASQPSGTVGPGGVAAPTLAWNPADDTWRSLDDLPASSARFGDSVIVLAGLGDGRTLLAGGDTGYVLNELGSASWTPVAPLAAPGPWGVVVPAPGGVLLWGRPYVVDADGFPEVLPDDVPPIAWLLRL